MSENKFRTKAGTALNNNKFHWSETCFRSGYRSNGKFSKAEWLRRDMKRSEGKTVYAEYLKDYVHYKRENRRFGDRLFEFQCKAWHFVKSYKGVARWYLSGRNK